MLNNIDDKKLEETINRAKLTDIKDLVDFKLAHELAHCLREHDTEKFIFIYDFKIPDTFDTERLDRLKENSRILSELNQTEFGKVCDDLKCEMEQNRIVKNEEYFRHKSLVESNDRIRYENDALVKKFFADSDEESGTARAFSLPKLTGQSASMCRDGFVTNHRYQTYKDNKRNETQLTSCYDEVYQVKNNESDDVESEEKLSSSASSSISYRSTKQSDHVIINMTNDDDEHLGAFENKYKQQDEYLEALKNECKLGTRFKSEDNDAARSDMAYKLMAQSQLDRNKFSNTNQMRDDFNKTYDDENESDSAPNFDNSQILLNDILSKLVEKNNHKTSSLQFNNYKFDAYEKSETKIGNESIDGSRLVCKNDNLDSHGSSMTNSSKHEDEDEEKDEDYEMDFDQYFPEKNAQHNKKNDCLEKTIDELSTDLVDKSKRSFERNCSTESSKSNSIKNAVTSAGFHQKYQNCAYFLNCSNPESQQPNSLIDEKSAATKKSKPAAANAKKSHKKGSNNQINSKNNSMYSKHWTEDVDSLLEFITSTSIKSEQKPNKPKKQNTETSTPNNNSGKNASKKNKKSESESRPKVLSPDNTEISEPTIVSPLNVDETIEIVRTKINDSSILPQIEQPNVDNQLELPDTEFVTVIKGKKVKKESKESKDLNEPSKNETNISTQSNSKKNNSNKYLEKQKLLTRNDDSVKKKSVDNTLESKNDDSGIVTQLLENFQFKEETTVKKETKNEHVEIKSASAILENSINSESDQKNRILKKSMSTSSNKKTPVVFLDEIRMKKSESTSLSLDIKFGLSTDEEDAGPVCQLADPKTNNSDTDQTILVKKKGKLKRNKSARIASKQLDLIQNNHSSDSSLNPSTSCDETEASKNPTIKKKSTRRRPAESTPESGVNSQEAEQSSSGLGYQGYYAQPFTSQYQPYIFYQIDPNTNLPVALIPVNGYNIAPQANIDTASPISHPNQYYPALDLNAYNYQLANYQYMQQLGLGYQTNMMPMAYGVFVPPNGHNESQTQINVQSENKTQRPAENVSDCSSVNTIDYNHQNSTNFQHNHNVPINYMYNHYPGHYASYPFFSNMNNNYVHRSGSFSMPNNHSNLAGDANITQIGKNENLINEYSNVPNINKHVANTNTQFKTPRYQNNAF